MWQGSEREEPKVKGDSTDKTIPTTGLFGEFWLSIHFFGK